MARRHVLYQWAVTDKDGTVFPGTVTSLRLRTMRYCLGADEDIADAEVRSGWRSQRIKWGWRLVRVEIREVRR